MEERRARATSGDVGIQRTPVDAVLGERGHCKSYILDGDAVYRSAICVPGVVEGVAGEDGKVVRPRNGGSDVRTVAARSNRPDSMFSRILPHGFGDEVLSLVERPLGIVCITMALTPAMQKGGELAVEVEEEPTGSRNGARAIWGGIKRPTCPWVEASSWRELSYCRHLELLVTPDE